MTTKEKWQQLEEQLSDLFTERGIIGRKVFALQSAEQSVGQRVVERFKGYQILSDSFKQFYIETFQLVNRNVPGPLPHIYADFVARQTKYFLTLRASEVSLLHGYPLQGYSLLRNLVEQAFIRSAVLTGVADYADVEGMFGDGRPFDPKAHLRKKKNAEREVFAKMFGDKSGLSSETIQQLRRWDDLFDKELHGLVLSMSDAVGFLKGEGPIAFIPEYNEKFTTMYINRFAEVGWMLHRLLALLQPAQIAFPAKWGEKWNALDASFQGFSEGLAHESGKRIGAAILELVPAKFPFSSSSRFPEDLT